MKVKLSHTQEISLNTKADHTILQSLWLNNLYNNKALCSGVGKCGKCKVRFVAPYNTETYNHDNSPYSLSLIPAPTKDEIEILTKEEIDSGIRLSCKHNAKSYFDNNINNEYYIELLNDTDEKNFSPLFKDLKEKSNFTQEQKEKVALAIDFGTSSIEYRFLALETKKKDRVLEQGKVLNPMQGIGSEVIARLAFAQDKDNAKALKKRTWVFVQDLIENFQLNHKGLYVHHIVFAANSALTALALGKETKHLAFAPYSLDYKGACFEKIEEDLAPVYIPPQLAPFVGGDISSGLYALTKQAQYPYLFVDMGTNAEFVLALSPEKMFLASVPLGPSIEGIGLSFGTIASPKTLLDFRLSRLGIKTFKALQFDKAEETKQEGQSQDLREIEENEEVDGMCGIAYIHLLHLLLKTGLLDTEGHFIKETTFPLVRKLANFKRLDSGIEVLLLPHNFFLSALDIESILKVKAAFSAAIEILLCEASLAIHSLAKIYLAGSFGKYVRLDALKELGFIPQILLAKIEQLGNTSLQGAELLCLSEEIQEAAQNVHEAHETKVEISKSQYTHIDLAKHKNFAKLYIQHFAFEDRMQTD